jgi:hypothetical protein
LTLPLDRIRSAIRGVSTAIENLEHAHLQLGASLIGRSADGTTSSSSRCLFTNALPKLGLLTNTLHEISDTFSRLNDNLESFKSSLNTEITQLLTQLENHSTLKINKKKYDKLSEVYEHALISSVSSRDYLTSHTENDLCNLRMNYELQRFDYVSQLNQNDCLKKFLLTKVTDPSLLLLLTHHTWSLVDRSRVSCKVS